MNKIWYILVNGKEEGPFSVEELKNETLITPDTLAWKEGFEKWIPIRNIPELQIIFKDEEEVKSDEDDENNLKLPSLSQTEDDQLILDMQSSPPFFWWLIFIIIILCYSFYLIYWMQS